MLASDISSALKDYGRSRAQALDILLPPTFDDDLWSERLRSWFAACATAPWRATAQPDLETAVTDLVTLELACQSYVATTDGLEVTDRGGTLWACRTLSDLLEIVARHDAPRARKLAMLAVRTRNDRLQRIRFLIVSPT